MDFTKTQLVKLHLKINAYLEKVPRGVAIASFVLLFACSAAEDRKRGPVYGSFGVDLAAVDASVAPGDDFFRHLHGTWLDTFEIPHDRSNYGTLTVLRERTHQQVREIIRDATDSRAVPGTPEQLIGDLFESFTNEKAIESSGLTPLQGVLAQIAEARSHLAILQVMARPDLDMNRPFDPFVNVDVRNPRRHAAYLGQDGLGLPGRNYYLRDQPRYLQIRAEYVNYISAIFRLAGIGNADDKAKAILELEPKIAQAHWPLARMRDRDLTYNPMSVDELAGYAPGVDWRSFFDAAGLQAASRVVVRPKGAMPKLAALFADTPVAVWRDYLSFHLLSDHAPYLPETFAEEAFNFYKRTLDGCSQYQGYEPIAGHRVNAELTMGENIADLGGLTMALEAYRISLDEGAAPIISGYTGEQRFFLGWAQIWRRKYRVEDLINRISTSRHSPPEFRTNGVVRNMDAWYDAFDLKADHALYVPPEERVRLW